MTPLFSPISTTLLQTKIVDNINIMNISFVLLNTTRLLCLITTSLLITSNNSHQYYSLEGWKDLGLSNIQSAKVIAGIKKFMGE